MDRAVEAPVTAVGVAVEILTGQAVVERGVEDGAIVAAAAGDADLPERAVPCGARCRLCRLDAGARRAFSIQIGAGTRFVERSEGHTSELQSLMRTPYPFLGMRK